jgi:hypothetical protein
MFGIVTTLPAVKQRVTCRAHVWSQAVTTAKITLHHASAEAMINGARYILRNLSGLLQASNDCCSGKELKQLIERTRKGETRCLRDAQIKYCLSPCGCQLCVYAVICVGVCFMRELTPLAGAHVDIVSNLSLSSQAKFTHYHQKL